ncbi:phosphomethylpyrimidine synthase ThiC, partial [Psychromonas aquatilis]
RLRESWITAREDVETLDNVTSYFAQERLADESLNELRFAYLPKPLRAKTGQCVTQLHFARQGIITPEMEYIA